MSVFSSEPKNVVIVSVWEEQLTSWLVLACCRSTIVSGCGEFRRMSSSRRATAIAAKKRAKRRIEQTTTARGALVVLATRLLIFFCF